MTLTFVEIFMSTNFHFFCIPDSGFLILGKPHRELLGILHSEMGKNFSKILTTNGNNLLKEIGSHIDYTFQDCNMPFSERKILFEAINRKNKFYEVFHSSNGGNWRGEGEEITL